MLWVACGTGKNWGALPSVLTFLVAKKKKGGFSSSQRVSDIQIASWREGYDADYALWTPCTLEKSRARLKAAAADVATSLVKSAF